MYHPPSFRVGVKRWAKILSLTKGAQIFFGHQYLFASMVKRFFFFILLIKKKYLFSIEANRAKICPPQVRRI